MKHFITIMVLGGILFGYQAVAQTEPPDLNPSELLPETLTNEGVSKTFSINSVVLPPDLLKEGSTTTTVKNIDDPEAVEDLTFDDVDFARVVFKGEVDLSADSTVEFIRNISDYMEFGELKVTVGTALYNTFDSAIEITFYNVPYVWDPLVQRNGVTLDESEVTNLNLKVENGKDVVSFIVRRGGTYTLVPKIGLLFENEHVVKHDTFTVRGRISDPDAVVELEVNTKKVSRDKLSFDSKTGEFEAVVELVLGSNLIVARANSKYGEVGDASKLVFFEERTTPVRESDGINPLIYLAIALVVITLLFILAGKLSKRK